MLLNLPQTKIVADTNVKKVFIKCNVWGNYGLYVGTTKIRDAKYKDDLTDYASEKYPNAEIVDKTI